MLKKKEKPTHFVSNVRTVITVRFQKVFSIFLIKKKDLFCPPE